ncbi:MAG: hypothetical protein IE926_14090, partial [Micrococcales bacterium]|nr:hypothetical protein [Micrococcales bacterium]
EVSGYQVSRAAIESVGVGLRPYDESILTRAGGFGNVDATGVRMYSFPGQTRQWNHPVGQAQYAVANLNSYRLNPDPRYLAIAEANGQRLVDRRVVSADAWYYPYDFDFAVHGDTTQTLRAPWYSSMAQGEALSAFSRLYQVTHDAKWLEAADRTYLSLVQAPEGEAPFASRVDSAGRLWFEEYPRYPVSQSEMVLNGHIFTMFGLYDYWQLTGRRADVGKLFLGGLRTMELTVRTAYRRPNWASVYSLHHAIPTISYHKTHIAQFLLLWRLTTDPQWISHAAVFREDFPEKNVPGTAVIRPGTFTIYRLDSDKRVVATRRVSFSRQTGAPYSTRHRIQGGPKALQISAGGYSGWWFPESSAVYGLGAVDVDVYAPKARLVLQAGRTYTFYRIDYRGNVLGSKRLTVTRTTSAPTNHSAVVLGRPSWYVTAGWLAGYYVAFQTGVGASSY